MIGRRLWRRWSGKVGGAIVLALLLTAFVVPRFYRTDPYKINIVHRLRPPSAAAWLGTDEFGRDLLARIIHGAPLTLVVGTICVGIAGTFGTGLGLLAGYYGRRVDLVISAAVDVMLAFPGFLLALAIVATLGPSLQNAMIAIGIRRIPIFVRIARSATLSVIESEYVIAARSLGARDARIVLTHVLRNVWAPLLVLATLQFPEAILTTAGLSFLGLGAQPPTPEWGALLTGARVYLWRAPWLVNYPGLAILITVLGFNLLGDALRDVLDPRMQAPAQ